jgi:hypothetical protein
MQLFLRLAACTLAAVTLCQCQTANSAANLLMAPVKLATRTVGLSASVDNPDSSARSVADRGRLIESKGDYHGPAVDAGTTTVAQR